MNRTVIIAFLVLVAAVSSLAATLITNSRASGKPALTEEQGAAREKFFGSGKELPPIKDGQEMRPRW
ncbi:entry exclusion protein TrbK [Phyllobacterium zundukense]|uniref:Entry exclusion protein TrbK n=1 Tax=Phyllobacterium zundukense TaxID=1867719 RepID=A0A2N9VT67_9HYPH|nr:entry exclusion protein TrbK [Phyllobacterium zundukense]ATU95402.1 entry exclusion protein TrbK [Phyllobacterium zundukense]PIO42685.1 entry exclusion protein TrbK [Phyllobacterium zundukense]